jgi:CheY-like chemotaxis protein
MSAAKSPTVLVVDDEEVNRRLLEAMLEREGYAVVHAAKRGTGARACATQSPGRDPPRRS